MGRQSISLTVSLVLKIQQTKCLIPMASIKKFMSLLMVILLVSCNEMPSKAPAGKDKNNKDSSVSKAISNSIEQDFYSSILKEKLPLNEQEFKDVIPIEINGFQLKDSKVMQNLQMIQATYGTQFKIVIQDYAGTDGKVIQLFNESYKNASGSNQIYKERDGYETKSSMSYGDSELSYVYLNRFVITLEGKKMTPDQLWEFFDPDLLSSLEILNQYNNRNH